MTAPIAASFTLDTSKGRKALGGRAETEEVPGRNWRSSEAIGKRLVLVAWKPTDLITSVGNPEPGRTAVPCDSPGPFPVETYLDVSVERCKGQGVSATYRSRCHLTDSTSMVK